MILIVLFYKSTDNCSQNIAINSAILGAIGVPEPYSNKNSIGGSKQSCLMGLCVPCGAMFVDPPRNPALRAAPPHVQSTCCQSRRRAVAASTSQTLGAHPATGNMQICRWTRTNTLSTWKIAPIGPITEPSFKMILPPSACMGRSLHVSE